MTLMNKSLIPEVKAVQMGAAPVPLNRLESIEISGLPAETVRKARFLFPELRVENAGRAGVFCAFAGAARGRFKPEELLSSSHAQGYVLRVSDGGAWIRAHDGPGLWYGLATLAQLLRRPDKQGCVPALEIHDWPAVMLRGIHLDMKGCQPKFAAMIDFARVLASHKINMILLEIEDRMVFRSAPGVAVRGAFSAAELGRFEEECRSLFIEVVPKVQCLAHVDYILKHERYRTMREAGHPYQYCPRNEAGLALWKAMASEVMEAMPAGRYFHIGADEPANLGECRICRRHSKADSYIYRVSRCIEHVANHGRRPVMWDDILRNLHRHMTDDEARRTWDLGRNAILMYWAYGYGGANNEFPFLPPYLDAGMEVWGASGASGCGPSWNQDLPPFRERALNMGVWSETAARFGLSGLVHTGWTKIASADPPAEPQEGCWTTILYGADAAWAGRHIEAEPWMEKMGKVFWGLEDVSTLSSLADAHERPICAESAPAAASQRERWELFCALSGLAAHRKERQRLIDDWQMYRAALRAGKLPDYRLAMVRSHLDAFERARRSRMRAVAAALGRFYTPATVSSYLESRFGIDEEIIARLKTLLKRSSVK